MNFSIEFNKIAIKKPNKNNSIFYYMRKVLLNTFLFLFSCFLIGLIYLTYLSKDLPSLEQLQQWNPEEVTKIMSADGKLLGELSILKRDVVKIDKTPFVFYKLATIHHPKC